MREYYLLFQIGPGDPTLVCRCSRFAVCVCVTRAADAEQAPPLETTGQHEGQQQVKKR